MSTEIATKEASTDTLAELQRTAKIFVASGYFADTKDLAQACVKILAGKELGFSPMASMTGIYIVKGKPSLSANLMASKIGTSGFRHEVRVINENECSIMFYQGDRELGLSTFTIQDAQKAGILGNDTWKKFPRNMLFARAMSNGCRWFCASAFGGQAPYTPEELGAVVDDNGAPRRVGKTQSQAAQDLQARLNGEPATVEAEFFFEPASTGEGVELQADFNK